MLYLKQNGVLVPVGGGGGDDGPHVIEGDPVADAGLVDEGQLLWDGGIANSPVVSGMVFSNTTDLLAYFAGKTIPIGTRAYSKTCEYMWAGTVWRAIPFFQGQTVVLTRSGDATTYFLWTYPVPFHTLKAQQASCSHDGAFNVTALADPSAYDPKVEMRFFSNTGAATWRFELQAWGWLDDGFGGDTLTP